MQNRGAKCRRTTKRLLVSGILTIVLLTLASYGCGGGGGGGGATNYSLGATEIRFHNFVGSGLDTFYGYFRLYDNSGPIQDTDIQDVSVTNSSGGSISTTSDGFVSLTYYSFNCKGGSCTAATGPHDQTGAYGLVDILPPDTYHVEVLMENNQLLSADIEFQRQMILPVIDTGSMSATYQPNGDLLLDWDNPTGATNWSEVGELRIVIMDDTAGAGAIVMFIAVNATDPSEVTIPASLVADAETLSSDGVLHRWIIRTQAYDTNGMNDARGYTISVDLPAP